MTQGEKPDWDAWRESIIGLGEQSARKSYYPELQKRLEELRSSHQSLRDLMDSMYDAVMLHDYEGQILEVNESMLTMYKLRREEIANYKVSDLSVPGEQLQKIPEIWERVKRGDKNVLYEWKAIKPATQEEFDVEVALRRFQWEGIELIVGVLRDISERKKAEKEKLRLTQELERHKTELERMLYVFGHDMRSPVVNIQGFGGELENCLNEMRSLLPSSQSGRMQELLHDEIPSALHYIQSSTLKLAQQIDGMLRVGRMGQAILQIRPLECKALFSTLLDAMGWQLKEAGATVTLHDLPPCMGDAQWLSQVFANLADNALKYRSPERPLHLDISGEVVGSEVRYAIADNGRGIRSVELDRIWEIFFRGVNKATVSGEGLGLTMARNIVERHGGTISVQSQEGVGSCFWVNLPSPG